MPTEDELLKSAMKAFDAGDKELAKRFMNEAQALEHTQSTQVRTSQPIDYQPSHTLK